MSNILIIKHGSLGDIAQISGVLRDIRETYNSDRIFILTTIQYAELLARCPFVDGVLIDKRLSRWNILYLLKLKKMVGDINFLHAIDLQNSSRTSFYRKYLFNIENWSSTETILKPGQKKSDFDQDSVLARFKIQLENSKIKTRYCLKPDFSWASIDVNQIINKFLGKNFILMFPFSSPQLLHKQWPHYNELIRIIRSKHPNLEIVIAPGPNELEDAGKIDAISISKALHYEKIKINEIKKFVKNINE